MHDKWRSWVETLLQRPTYAAGFALLCTIVPFTEWVGWSWLVLTQLRYGLHYSVLVLVAISVGAAFVIGVVNGFWDIAFIHIVMLAVPIWIFSIVLRASVSLSFTLQAMAISLLIVLFLVGLINGNEPLFMEEFLHERLNQVVVMDAAFEQGIVSFAYFFVLSWPMGLFLSYALSLFLGRWWQAALDNPGGFKREFHALRLNTLVGGGAIILILLNFWVAPNMVLMAAGFLAASVLIVAGLGLVHFYVQAKQWSNWVLVGIYIGMLLLPYVVVPLLAMVAAVDSAADLRKRLS